MAVWIHLDVCVDGKVKATVWTERRGSIYPYEETTMLGIGSSASQALRMVAQQMAS